MGGRISGTLHGREAGRFIRLLSLILSQSERIYVSWAVDTAGIVHFQCGVFPTKLRGSNIWCQVSASEHLDSNPNHNLGFFSRASFRRKNLDVKTIATTSEGESWLLRNYATIHRRYGNATGI